MRKHFVPRCILWGLVLFWCQGVEALQSAELADRIVAIVNDECITLSELNGAVEPLLENIRKNPYAEHGAREMSFNLRRQVLDRMIDQKLAKQEAERLKISVDENEVDQYLERTKSEHFLTDEELRKALSEEGFTWEEYQSHVREQLLRMKLINLEVKSKVAITEDDIRDYYERHKEEFSGEHKYHLRSLFIGVPASAGAADREKALERIRSIERSLSAGAPGAFDELVQRFSEEALAVKGGDLGFFTLGELSEKVRELVRVMKEGDTSPVLETPNGYQILMLEEIKNAPGKTLKEASIEIQNRLYQELVEERYEAWVRKLRERSYVKIIQ